MRRLRFTTDDDRAADGHDACMNALVVPIRLAKTTLVPNILSSQ